MAKSSNILSGIEESVRFGFPKDQFPRKDKAPTPKAAQMDNPVLVPGIGVMEKEQAEKAIIYRIFPTKSQRETLSKWFGVRRYIYNKVLYYIRNLDQVKFKMPSKKELRAKFINNNNYENVDKWVLDYDYDSVPKYLG